MPPNDDWLGLLHLREVLIEFRSCESMVDPTSFHFSSVSFLRLAFLNLDNLLRPGILLNMKLLVIYFGFLIMMLRVCCLAGLGLMTPTCHRVGL